MKVIIINSERQKIYCKSLIDEMPLDGSNTVITKKTDKDQTAKQRGLNWLWNGEISRSGLGQNDTKNGVHLTAKWMFARPILLRDNIIFNGIFHYFMKIVDNSPNRSRDIKTFTDEYISTEKMTRKQRAEFLRDLQSYWIRKGVNLTEPKMQGVDLDKYIGDRI